MSMKLPPAWATNANYATGPDTGAPTKIDPSSSANGFIRGVVAAPQHVNYLLDKQVAAGRRAFELAALQLRKVSQDGVTITDTAELVAAVQRNQGTPLVAVKTAQAFGLGDWARLNVQAGTPTSITSNVSDAATNGTRIVVIGQGGQRCTFSDDDGATWTTGGEIGATVRRLVYFTDLGRFVTVDSSGGDTHRSTNATSWDAPASANVSGSGGLAVGGAIGSKRVFGLSSASTPPAFRRSADATTWSNTSGTVANAGSFDERGSVAGNQGELIYHAGRLNSGATIQVSSSGDGDTWSTIATLTAQGSASFASAPRIMICQNTGLLVLVASTSGAQCALYASVDGSDWVGPQVLYPDPGVNAFALAGGKLIATYDAMLFASDGIGFSGAGAMCSCHLHSPSVQKPSHEDVSESHFT